LRGRLGPRAPALRRRDFVRARDEGLRANSELFIALLVRGDSPRVSGRLGITVTRKVGNAVRRNRIKRLVREWYRSAPRAGGDLVVIAKRGIPAELGCGQVCRDLDVAWGRLCAASGR